jgi:hypothetical protein
VTDRHQIFLKKRAGLFSAPPVTLAFCVFGFMQSDARAEAEGASARAVPSASASPVPPLATDTTASAVPSTPPTGPIGPGVGPAPASSSAPAPTAMPVVPAAVVPGATPAAAATSTNTTGVVPSSPPAAAEPSKPRGKVGTVEDFMERDTTWDLNLEGGLGGAFTEAGTKLSGMFRARAGVMFVRAPHFFTVGASYQWSNRSYATIDIQAEYMHLTSGLWLQVGPLLDLEHTRPGVMVSGGISIIGVELQQRSFADLGVSTVVMGKIRAPLGFLFWAFRQK